MNYPKQAKGHYYDLVKKTITNGKPKHGNYIYFDSTGEYRLWQSLRRIYKDYPLHIETHHKLHLMGNVTWKIDFRLVALNKEAMMYLSNIAVILCGYNDDICDSVYIEYKGVIDPNFDKKMTHVYKYNKDIFNRIIINSKYGNAWFTYNNANGIITKHIYPTDLMLKELKRYLP